MGSLIIKKVLYEGDKYSYESPELSEGINIIIGDNGSGKSTFTYFIEYCLGGYLKYFNEENDEDKYYEIINSLEDKTYLTKGHLKAKSKNISKSLKHKLKN